MPASEAKGIAITVTPSTSPALAKNSGGIEPFPVVGRHLTAQTEPTLHGVGELVGLAGRLGAVI